MSYRFELQVPAEAELRRIALEQIDRVVRELTAQEERAVAVHESRKGLKRLRALLRLARPGIGEDVYKAENTRLREIGALLSGARDRQVLSDVAGKLETAMHKKASKAFANIRQELDKPPARRGRNGHSVEKEATERLAEVRKDLGRLKLKPPSFTALQAGLEFSYRRGRRMLRRAYATPDDEAFHELRKSIQQHWRHMALLSRAWPDLFDARVAAARRLSQILGDDHDLAVFASFVRALPRSAVSATDLREIEQRCVARQGRLRAKAEPLCAQLYAERARRFSKRIALMWDAAEVSASREGNAPEASRKARPRRGKTAQAPKPAG